MANLMIKFRERFPLKAFSSGKREGRGFERLFIDKEPESQLNGETSGVGRQIEIRDN